MYSYVSSNGHIRSEGNHGKRMGKLETWQLTNFKNINEVIAEARNEDRTVLFSSELDLCHLKNSELEPKLSEVQRQKRRHCEVWFRSTRSINWVRIISITNDRYKSDGHYIETVRIGRTSSRRSIDLHQDPHERCIDVTESLKVGMSRYFSTRLSKHDWSKSWCSMEDPVVPLKEISTIILGQNCGKDNSCSKILFENSTKLGMHIR